MAIQAKNFKLKFRESIPVGLIERLKDKASSLWKESRGEPEYREYYIRSDREVHISSIATPDVVGEVPRRLVESAASNRDKFSAFFKWQFTLPGLDPHYIDQNRKWLKNNCKGMWAQVPVLGTFFVEQKDDFDLILRVLSLKCNNDLGPCGLVETDNWLSIMPLVAAFKGRQKVVEIVPEKYQRSAVDRSNPNLMLALYLRHGISMKEEKNSQCIDWCKKNASKWGFYSYGQNTMFLFENEKDAMAFKLKFG